MGGEGIRKLLFYRAGCFRQVKYTEKERISGIRNFLCSDLAVYTGLIYSEREQVDSESDCFTELTVSQITYIACAWVGGGGIRKVTVVLSWLF